MISRSSFSSGLADGSLCKDGSMISSIEILSVFSFTFNGSSVASMITSDGSVHTLTTSEISPDVELLRDSVVTTARACETSDASVESGVDAGRLLAWQQASLRKLDLNALVRIATRDWKGRD